MDHPENFAGFPLDTVSLLESPDGWLDWEQDMRDCLALAGYGFLLEPLPGPDVTASVMVKDRSLHEVTACAAIRYRCAPHIKRMIRGANTVFTLFQILGRSLAPKGDASFLSVYQEYDGLNLADYRNVDEYAEKFRKINDKFTALHHSIVIPECMLVQKFLSGLGPQYGKFRSNFNRNHPLVPSDESGDAGVTFMAAVLAAVHEEELMSAYAAAGTPLAIHNIPMAHDGANAPDITTEDIPYCTHCKMLHHSNDNCRKLHPELRRFRHRDNRRTALNRKKLRFEGKKRMIEGEDDDGKDNEAETR